MFGHITAAGLEKAELAGRVAHQHTLSLLVVRQHHFVVFAADAGFFVAAKCRVGGVEVVAIGPHAPGLDYPGVGPQHCHLKDIGRARYETATDAETLAAFLTLSREEGIIPALESAHAIAYALRRAAQLDGSQRLLVNLSGRGDKDIDFAIEQLKL